MKKKTIRLTAMILFLAMLFCAIPQSVLAETSEALNDLLTNESETVPVSDGDVYVLGEVIDSRTESSKTFRMSDGSFVAADYGKPIHYSDENGDWQDYDNTLSYSDAVDSEDIAGYGTSESNISIKLANNSNSGNLLKIKMNGYKISLSLPDANKSKALELYPQTTVADDDSLDSATTLTKFSSGAIYKDILDGTDLEYIISGSNVKENIIVKEKQDSYVYTFELKLNGLVPVLNEDGSISLNDENSGETQLVIPKGIMSDANYAVSDGVTYSIAHKNGKKYTLTVTADAEWIDSDDRVFPVKIDPSVEAFNSMQETLDAYISQNSPNQNTVNNSTLVTGYYYGSTAKEWHTLIEPASLPDIPESAVVVNSYMQFGIYAVGYTSVNIAAKPITQEWNSYTVTWNNKPSYGNEILDYASIDDADVTKTVKFDITRLAQEWYNPQDNIDNCHGVALVPISGNGTGHVYFYSSESYPKPLLIIEYRDTKGLESIWTYSSHGAGSAGTGYVNGFNGNLVFVHDDISTKGSILPITVSHVYNSYLAVDDEQQEFDTAMPVGKGWKLSVQETLSVANIDGVEYYRYNDADGTDLYFYKSGNVYKSEDGYGLTVTVTETENDTIATLADDYGNTKTFVNGRITKIQDVYGNKKQFKYNTSNKLTSITYTPAGTTYEITQLTFVYNPVGTLAQITNAQDTSDCVNFYYSTTYNGSIAQTYYNYLRKIEYPSGEYCTYEYYSDGMLKSTYDSDTGYTVTYTYNGFRVATVAESVGTSQGQKIGFEYADKYFSVRSSGKDDIYDNTDDLYTVTLFDNYGRAICSYTEDYYGNVYGASYAKYTENDVGLKTNNKLTVSSVKGITAENLIKDGDCESVDEWTTEYSGSGYSAALSSAEKLFGNYSIKLYRTSATGYVCKTQSVTVPEKGIYTLSAYVKTTGVSSSGGAYIQLKNTKSEYVTGTTDTTVQNGWRRISVTAELLEGANTIYMCLDSATGTAYFDNVQLERAEVESDYNFIQDSSVRTSDYWEGTFSELDTELERGHVGAVTGSASAAKSVYQTIPLNVPANTTFMVSGWARANSVDLHGNRRFGLSVTLTYSDNTTEEHYADFNPENTGWQYLTAAVVPQKELTVTSAKVAFVYDYNCNSAYFDDISFTIEPAQTYAYDDDGNLESATDIYGQNDTALYDGVDLKSYESINNGDFEYTYKEINGINTHDVETAVRTVNGVTQTLTYSYNNYGNVTGSVLSNSVTSEIISSSATYTDNGNFLESSTDSLGGTTSYGYDSVTKLLKYIQDANNNRTAYSYDNRDRVTTVYLDADKDETADTTESSVAYLYASGRLSGINTATTAYTITYDAFGNMVSVSAGSNVLATYTYTAGNGKLTRMTYGNGEYEEYTYDNLDRLVKVTYNGSAENAFTVVYDSNGRLAKAVDGKAGLTYVYEYDSLDRLIRAYQKDASGNTVFAVENSYDEFGRAKGSKYVIDGVSRAYNISYKENTNLVSSYTTPEMGFAYSYDSFDRLISKYNPLYAYSYEYLNGTSLVSKLYVGTNTLLDTDEYSYTYDDLGNIVAVRKDGVLISEYEYDALGQLIREDDVLNSKAYVYAYDNAGNILKTYTFDNTGPNVSHWMAVYPVLGEITETYSYSDSAWGDLLTNYNGTNISYDRIGNPTNWIGISSLSWDGRELDNITISNNHTVDYTYNSDGIRTRKYEFNGNEQYLYDHSYVLDGSTIVKETIQYSSAFNGDSTTVLEYYYDESGVTSFRYNGTVYHYIKNLQGDVIGIVNSNNGAIVVEYAYDAWGNILSTTGSLASTVGQINPFRYRGYYYDSETGLYYLNSRYYDAEVGRFINADAYASTGQGILGNNMFAYCLNNPAMYVDYNGLVATTPVCFSNGYNNADIKRTFKTPWGYLILQVEVVLTNLPEASVALGSITVEYDMKNSITITTPNGEELEFELTSTNVALTAFSSTLYDNDSVQIDTVFVENGFGLSFSIRNDNYELTGSITHEFYTLDDDVDNHDIVCDVLFGAALITALKGVCSFVGSALSASASVGSFPGYNIGNPLDGYIHAECFGIEQFSN
ncbi:MAG: RHS repeat protein [Clostridia bacterium]|nr:RHS repeat protein [Clostridia bacterium]